MTSLLIIVATFLSPNAFTIDNVTNNLGDWGFEVETPDMTYKGVMTFSEENGEIVGVMSVDGEETELSDVVIDGNDLSFNMEVQGFNCEITGTFDGDTLAAEVSVEGMALPLVAKRL